MSKISIVIPMFNIENYIKKCLESLISQDYQNLEIIVVNDGSTDNSVNIVTKFSEKDNRILLLHQENKGSSEARKLGLSICTGEYILFVDGDDWLEKNTISTLYKHARETGSDILCYNAKLIENNNIKIFKQFNLDNFTQDNDYIKMLFLNQISPTLWSKFVKRNFLEGLSNPFIDNISYGEDLASITGWFLNKPKISFCEEFLYNYNKRSSSITNTVSEKVLQINDALLYIKTILKESNNFDKYRIYYEYLVYIHLFESKVINISFKNPIHQQLYILFMNYNIDLKNRYIIKKISNQRLRTKIKIKMYLNSYNFGLLYDKFKLIFIRE